MFNYMPATIFTIQDCFLTLSQILFGIQEGYISHLFGTKLKSSRADAYLADITATQSPCSTGTMGSLFEMAGVPFPGRGTSTFVFYCL